MTIEILEMNGGEICDYFDWVAIHAYPNENNIHKILSISDYYIQTISDYCGFSPTVAVTEMGWALPGGVKYNAHYYAKMYERAFEHPNMVYAGYHDFEFNKGENFPNITLAIINAMNMVLSP